MLTAKKSPCQVRFAKIPGQNYRPLSRGRDKSHAYYDSGISAWNNVQSGTLLASFSAVCFAENDRRCVRGSRAQEVACYSDSPVTILKFSSRSVLSPNKFNNQFIKYLLSSHAVRITHIDSTCSFLPLVFYLFLFIGSFKSVISLQKERNKEIITIYFSCTGKDASHEF